MTAELPFRKMPPTAELSIHVVVTKEFRFRLWVATILFSLAARVLGMKPSVKGEVSE